MSILVVILSRSYISWAFLYRASRSSLVLASIYCCSMERSSLSRSILGLNTRRLPQAGSDPRGLMKLSILFFFQDLIADFSESFSEPV